MKDLKIKNLVVEKEWTYLSTIVSKYEVGVSGERRECSRGDDSAIYARTRPVSGGRG